MIIDTNKSIVLVERSDANGMQCSTYEDRLDMVFNVINNGAIGGKTVSSWGDDAHKFALDEIERKIQRIRDEITKQDEVDSAPYDEGAEND